MTYITCNLVKNKISKTKMSTFQLFKRFEIGKSIIGELKGLNHERQCQLLFGKYKIDRLVGRGAFGWVYRAINMETNREVAMKIIDFEEISSYYMSEQTRAKIKDTLLTEESHLRKCHSAHIIKVIDSFENDNCKVIILEYCNSGTLQDYLRKRGAIEESDAIAILKQILFGIAEMHRNGIIHRDLKPDNILIHNGVFKIADLGFSKEISQEEITNHTCLGTKATMAPEVVNGEPYGLKADIWSIGVIFFMMVQYRSELDYSENSKRVLKFVMKNKNHQSKLLQNERMSMEVRDFLRKTLEVNQDIRLDWEQTLSHPVFRKVFDYLPQYFLPHVQEDFDNLKMLASELQSEIVNPEQHLNYQCLNAEYLQCRKTEYFLNKLVVPLQERHLLNLKDQRHIQFLYLLIARCNLNISHAQQQIKLNYSQVQSQSFNKFIKPLYERVKLKFQSYSELLRLYESKFSQIIKDTFTKLTSKTAYIERQKFLTGIQGIDFDRQQQINFTYEKYIIDIINELKGNRNDEESIKSILKHYRYICQLSKKETAGVDLRKVIRKMIQSDDS